MKRHMFSAMERLMVPSVELWEITKDNFSELRSRKEMMNEFLNQFGTDSKSISHFYKKYYSDAEYTEWLDDMENMLNSGDGQFIFIRESGTDNIVGFLMLGTVSWLKDTAFLYSFYIHKPYRGKGYANMAMTQLLDYIKHKTKFKHVSLEVLEGNDRARHIYKKFGFVDYAHNMFKENI